MKRSYNSFYKSINRKIDKLSDISESDSDPDDIIYNCQSYTHCDDHLSINSNNDSIDELRITSEHTLDSDSESNSHIVANSDVESIDELNTPSEHILDSESNLDSEPIEKSFKQNIAQLVSAHNVSHNFTDSLLKLLQKEHLDVPSTCRTLLMYNSIKNINITNSYNVEYYYFGLEFMIRNILKNYPIEYIKENNHLKISINIDGLPINKSTTKSMWPILIRIASYDIVFPIAITLGSKPSIEYLNDAVDELVKLCNDGLMYDSIFISLSIISIICDAPAKSFVKNIIQFNGYFGCDKCVQKGLWYSSESERGGRMTYPLLNSIHRTD